MSRPDLNKVLSCEDQAAIQGYQIDALKPDFLIFSTKISRCRALTRKEKRQGASLEVLSNILGGGASSRLFRRLVVNAKIAVSSGAYYSGDHRGPGRFVFYASPRGDTPLEVLEKSIATEITDIIKNGVTREEVEEAKERMAAEAIYARDSLSGGARILGAALASGLTVKDVESWPERIAAITQDEIQSAAKALFNNKNSVTGILLPIEDH